MNHIKNISSKLSNVDLIRNKSDTNENAISSLLVTNSVQSIFLILPFLDKEPISRNKLHLQRSPVNYLSWNLKSIYVNGSTIFKKNRIDSMYQQGFVPIAHCCVALMGAVFVEKLNRSWIKNTREKHRIGLIINVHKCKEYITELAKIIKS